MEKNYLYKKVYDGIKKDIISGKYKSSKKIPTEDELCKIYNVSKITIRDAVERLAAEGYLDKIQGKGMFINEKRTALINRKPIGVYVPLDEIDERKYYVSSRIFKGISDFISI